MSVKTICQKTVIFGHCCFSPKSSSRAGENTVSMNAQTSTCGNVRQAFVLTPRLQKKHQIEEGRQIGKLANFQVLILCSRLGLAGL